MSKAALDQLTVQMAGQLIHGGIRVNSQSTLEPLAPTSRLPQEVMMEKYKDVFADCSKIIPLGKIGQPEDIGKVILFLADRTQSEVIVGQRIVADGGTFLKNVLISAEM